MRSSILFTLLVVALVPSNLYAQPSPTAAATANAAIEKAHALVPQEGVACLTVRLQQIKLDQALRLLPWEVVSAGSLDALGVDFSKAERFDLIVGPISQQPGVAGIFTSTSKLDPAELSQQMFQADESGKTFRIVGARQMEDIRVTSINDNQIAISNPVTLSPLLTAQRGEGDLLKQMKRLGEGGHVSLVVVPSPVRPLLSQAAEQMRPEFRNDAKILIDKIQLIAARAQVDVTPVVNVLIETSSDADAQLVENSWNQLLGRLALAELGKIPNRMGSSAIRESVQVYMTRVVDDFLLQLKPTRKGNRLLLTLDQRAINLWRGFAAFSSLAPMIQASGRDGNSRPARAGGIGDTDENRLKLIGLAAHNFESAFKTLPTGGDTNYMNRKQLSWRVQILPFLGDPELTQLFQKFKLDEPWDSENNAKLLINMPAIYNYSKAKVPPGHTVVHMPFGPGLISEEKKKMPFNEITDGLSRTVLFALSKDEAGVPWTKPEDFNPFEHFELVRTDNNSYTFVMADGSTMKFPSVTKPDELKALLTRAAGD